MFYNMLGLRESSCKPDDLSALLHQHECYISSVSIIEAVVFYHNNLETLKEVMAGISLFRANISIGFMPFDCDAIIPRILASKSLSEISDILDKCRQTKMQTEGEFARFVEYAVLITLSLCNNILIKDYGDEVTKRFSSYLSAYMESNKDIYLRKMILKITEGYEKRIPQKNVKEEFDFDIRLADYLIRVFAYAAKNDIAIFSGDEDEERKIEPFRKVTLKGSGSPLSNVGKVDRALAYFRDGLMERPQFRGYDIVLDYVIEIARKILLTGAKFRINDIADLLILYTLYPLEENRRILTHDSRMREYLESVGRSYSI